MTLGRAIQTAASAAAFDLVQRRLSVRERIRSPQPQRAERAREHAPLQQSKIRLVNIFAPKNEDYLFDLVVGREKFAGRFNGNPRCFRNRITIGTATDCRESYRLDIVFDREPQRIPLPPHWGGYRVKPDTMEFWQGRPNRLHDRFRYTRQADGNWLIERLAP